MRDELQIRIKQSKRRGAENVLCRVDSILAQWVSFSRACLGRTNQSHIVMEGIDRRLRAFKSVARASAPSTIIVNCILPSNEDLPRLLVKCHAPQRATGVFQDTCRLALSPPRDDKCQNPARCRDVKNRHSSVLRFETGDGFLRFKDNALSRATIMDQIAANNGYRSVCETDRYLRQIVDDCKCRNLKKMNLASQIPTPCHSKGSAPEIAFSHSAPPQSTNTSARHLSSPYREPRL